MAPVIVAQLVYIQIDSRITCLKIRISESIHRKQIYKHKIHNRPRDRTCDTAMTFT